MATLRDQLLTLELRRRDIVWGDSDLTDTAVVADLANVQREIDRLMTSIEARSLVAEARRALDQQTEDAADSAPDVEWPRWAPSPWIDARPDGAWGCGRRKG